MKQFIPFSNGSEFMNWQENNCLQCDNYESESTEEKDAGCRLAFSLDLNFLINEAIPESVVDQIGFTDKRTQGNLHFCDLCNRCKKFNTELVYENPNQLALF